MFITINEISRNVHQRCILNDRRNCKLFYAEPLLRVRIGKIHFSYNLIMHHHVIYPSCDSQECDNLYENDCTSTILREADIRLVFDDNPTRSI